VEGSGNLKSLNGASAVSSRSRSMVKAMLHVRARMRMRRTPARRSFVTSTVAEGWKEVACARRQSASNTADTSLHGFGALTSLMEGSDSDGDDGAHA
jgi:hypothetical protein